MGTIGYAVMAKENGKGKGIKEETNIFGTFIYENKGK